MVIINFINCLINPSLTVNYLEFACYSIKNDMNFVANVGGEGNVRIH